MIENNCHPFYFFSHNLPPYRGHCQLSDDCANFCDLTCALTSLELLFSLTESARCRELLKARWCEPTLSVVDVRIGDEDGSGDSAYRFGPTRFSVIPRSAVGNVSIRFVPDQDAEHLIQALRFACQVCRLHSCVLLGCYVSRKCIKRLGSAPHGFLKHCTDLALRWHQIVELFNPRLAVCQMQLAKFFLAHTVGL